MTFRSHADLGSAWQCDMYDVMMVLGLFIHYVDLFLDNFASTVGKNARSSKTKMYKQKSNELSIITIRYMHKAKKTTPVPDSFLK